MTVAARADNLASSIQAGQFREVGYTSPSQRLMLGFDGSRSDDGYIWGDMKIAWNDPKPLTLTLKADMLQDRLIALLTGRAPAPKKETTMTVDRKLFVLKATPVKAEALAHKHLGSLVTVTLPSGAEITDILVGIQSGNPHHSRHNGEVAVFLQNVRTHDDYSPRSDFGLDPKSVVQVRRPRPVVATKAGRK